MEKNYRNCSNCANCEKAPSHPNYKDSFGWCNAVVPFFANHKPLIKKERLLKNVQLLKRWKNDTRYCL